jgi:hypothetical protein
MAKKPQKQEPVGLHYPAQYYYSCVANRYAVERDDGFTIVHFGLVNRLGLLIDRMSCIFPQHTLDVQKENLVQYSDDAGLPKKKVPAWVPPVRGLDAEITYPVIDFVYLSRWNDAHAEICLWNYSQGLLADAVKAGIKEHLTPWGVAMVRCDIDLQRAFLNALYEEETEK